jgi:hypothetical protein
MRLKRGKNMKRLRLSHLLLAGCSLAVPSRARAQSTPGITWVQVPGALFPSDCVHPVPNGATVDPTGDVTLNSSLVAHYDPCPVPPIWTRPVPPGTPSSPRLEPSTGGWIEGAQANFSSDNLDWIYSEWVVPENPVDDGATIYLFNALEPASQDAIIQPVLQWGVSQAGGGNFWGISSWLVNSTNGYPSPLIEVTAGDIISGSVKITSQSGSDITWAVVTTDVTTGQSTTQGVISNGGQWTWGYTAILEAYNVGSCSQFPNNSIDYTFWNTFLDDAYPSYNHLIYGGGFSGIAYYANDGYSGPNCGFGGEYYDSTWVLAF